MATSLAIAAILGGALGSVAFVGVVIFFVWFFLCRPRNVTSPATIELQNVSLPYRNFPRIYGMVPSNQSTPVELETHGSAESSSLLQNVIQTQQDFSQNLDQNVSRTSEAVPSSSAIQVETPGREESPSQGGRIFDIEELRKATGDFSMDNFIREGRFGCVYRGILPDGTLVTVKERRGEQTRDFSDAVHFLSSIHHQNLVTLLGHCQENNLQFLVYQHIPHGSLSSHLFCDADQVAPQMREFKHRLSIAIGAAKGLAYLHFINPDLMHREFKTANVLVDESYECKVVGGGDWMFRRSDGLEGPSSQVAADEIFLAPEVIKHAYFSTLSDVYSFGIFLLELVSGRHATAAPFSDSSMNLVQWVRIMNAGYCDDDGIKRIADEKLGSSFLVEGMRICIRLVVRCVNPTRERRPRMRSMAEMVLELENGGRPLGVGII